MSREKLLIDASAVIARTLDEPGGDDVWRVMKATPSGGLFMHAVNVCEVAYHLVRKGFIEFLAYRLAAPKDVAVLDLVRPALWQRAAGLKARYKSLALGDCIAIAQAEELDAAILTGDRGFLKVDTFIEIKLFR